MMLISVFYLALLYDFAGLRFLLGCILMIPLGSLLLLILQVFSCRFYLGEADWVYRGEGTELSVTLENRGFLPLGRVSFTGRLQVPGEGEMKLRRYVLGVRAKECREERFFVEAGHCGEIVLSGAKVKICDVLGLFALPTRGAGKISLYVLPRADLAYGRELERVVQSSADALDDIYIRGYRQGDSVHRIYWKLSAKEDKLQVRDYEPGAAVSFYLDFPQEAREQPDRWDVCLERAVSVLAYLSKPGHGVTEVVWNRGGSLCRYSVRTGDDVTGCMCAVLGRKSANAGYWENSVIALDQGYRLDGEGRLYLGGTLFL